MCALSVLQKGCRKVWGARYTLGAHYRSENTVHKMTCFRRLTSHPFCTSALVLSQWHILEQCYNAVTIKYLIFPGHSEYEMQHANVIYIGFNTGFLKTHCNQAVTSFTDTPNAMKMLHTSSLCHHWLSSNISMLKSCPTILPFSRTK